MASLATLLRPRRETQEVEATPVVQEQASRTRYLNPRSKTFRSSVPEAEDTGFAAITNIQSPVNLPFDMPWEVLGYMEVLAHWDPDFSAAVDRDWETGVFSLWN